MASSKMLGILGFLLILPAFADDVKTAAPAATQSQSDSSFADTVPYSRVPSRRTSTLKADEVVRLMETVENSGALGVQVEDAIADSAEHPIDYAAIDAAVEYFASRLDRSVRSFGSMKKTIVDRSRAQSQRKEKLSKAERKQLTASMQSKYNTAIYSLLNTDGQYLGKRKRKIREIENGQSKSIQIEFRGDYKEQWSTLHSEIVRLLKNCASESCQTAVVQAFRDNLQQVQAINKDLDYQKMGEGDSTLLFSYSNVILEASFRRSYDGSSGTSNFSNGGLQKLTSFASGVFLPLALTGYTSTEHLSSVVSNFTPVDVELDAPKVDLTAYNQAIDDADQEVTLLRAQGAQSLNNNRFDKYEVRKAELLGLSDLALISRAIYFRSQPPSIGTCVLQINDMALDKSVDLDDIQEALNNVTPMSYVLRNALKRGRATAVKDRDGKYVKGSNLVSDAANVAKNIRELLYADQCGEL